MASRMRRSITFPGTKVRLTGLTGSSMVSPSYPFLETGIAFAFFQSSGTNPDCHNLSQMIGSGLAMGSASCLSTHSPLLRSDPTSKLDQLKLILKGISLLNPLFFPTFLHYAVTWFLP